MNSKTEITQLLDKYFAAESSAEEEQLLSSYFNSEEVDASLSEYQPLFRFLQSEKEVRLSDDFETRLLQRIQTEQLQPVSAGARIRPIRLWLARAAALLLLGTVSWWVFRKEPEASEPITTIDWSAYEPKTVEEAYEITRKALGRASTELNRGATMAAEELGHMESMGKVLN